MTPNEKATVWPDEKGSELPAQKFPLSLSKGDGLSSLWKRRVGREFWELFSNGEIDFLKNHMAVCVNRRPARRKER
jgi:hypothetical protein